jgi:DNA-binding transcriptional MerR regulator
MTENDEFLRIGQLAATTGLSTQTIRYYEQIDLLPSAPRSANGYRCYDQTDVRRLRFIRNARQLGLSIEELREVQTMWDQGRPPCPQVAELVAQRIREVEDEIRRLQALKQDLQSLLAQSGSHPATAPNEPDCVCHLISNSEG